MTNEQSSKDISHSKGETGETKPPGNQDGGTGGRGLNSALSENQSMKIASKSRPKPPPPQGNQSGGKGTASEPLEPSE